MSFVVSKRVSVGLMAIARRSAAFADCWSQFLDMEVRGGAVLFGILWDFVPSPNDESWRSVPQRRWLFL